MVAIADLGCVAIGRNEGQRLVRCLDSLVGRVARVVYVDSGSTDGSVEAARARGVEVVALDTSIPFTAARARNAGVARLREIAPDARFVQLVDGDCEVVAGWLERAHAALSARRELAVVCGRRRERHPEHSVWNRIVDVEWDTPVGDAKACGGDAMMRLDALAAVGGFDPSLIAGEEPELCVRLRAAGWKIERLDAEMTLHDAAMERVEQWWKRTVRSGREPGSAGRLSGVGVPRVPRDAHPRPHPRGRGGVRAGGHGGEIRGAAGRAAVPRQAAPRRAEHAHRVQVMGHSGTCSMRCSRSSTKKLGVSIARPAIVR